MITSDRQYKTAKEKLLMLNEGLKAPVRTDLPEAVLKAALGQTQELASEIEIELREYETLRKENVDEIPIKTLEDLLTAPIRYRLARHWTLMEFAKKVQKDWRQIKRYEDAGYQNVTVTTLREILQRLDLSIRGKMDLLPHPRRLAEKKRNAGTRRVSRISAKKKRSVTNI